MGEHLLFWLYKNARTTPAVREEITASTETAAVRAATPSPCLPQPRHPACPNPVTLRVVAGSISD